MALVRRFVDKGIKCLQRLETCTRLAILSVRLRFGCSRSGGIKKLRGYIIRHVDELAFYYEYKDIFVQRIYHFESAKPEPLILDCGSYIGMSIFYFKRVYPKARIIAFEPDKDIFRVLQKNVSRNGLRNVELVNAGLSAEVGELEFVPDGTDGGRLASIEPHATSIKRILPKTQIPSVRLINYLTEPVDFLKMNIEGAEYEVLLDSVDRLSVVREMVIEYHAFEGMAQNLHKILDILARKGFKYLINHIDYVTNPAVRPPFKLDDKTRYFLLIYARQSNG